MNVHEAYTVESGYRGSSRVQAIQKNRARKGRGENSRWNPLARLDATGDIVGAERQRTRRGAASPKVVGRR